MRALLRLHGAVALALLASAAEGAALHVAFVSPRAGAPAYGKVDVVLEVTPEQPLSSVLLRVDGHNVATASRPTLHFVVDVGQANVEHLFEAEVVTSSGGRATASLSTPSIHVDEEVTFDLMQVYLTATRDGKPELGLRRRDFRVYDQGHEQTLASFERGDIPFTAVILVDASASMSGAKLHTAIDGARTFIHGMRPLDLAQVMVFSDRLLHATPITGVEGLGLAGFEPHGAERGTALDDNLFVALRSLEERQGRRVVVVLSDGLDSHSVLSIADVLGQARRSRALLYWLRLVDPAGGPTADDPTTRRSAWHNGEDYGEQVDGLITAAEESGGRVMEIRDEAEIAPAFEQILRELREQYVLGYYPTVDKNDGSWHEIKVRVREKGVGVRTSRGYADF
jgi:Ca-activated chloride channel homolog